MRLSVSSPRWSGCTRHPMSDNRQAAWRSRRSSSVSRSFDDPDQTIGPPDQFLGVARRARQQFVQVLRGADQSVLGALGRRQHLVEQAFAHAEGRKHDGLRLGDADDVFENQRRIGQQRPPRVGDDFDIGQHVGRRETAQPLREIERVRRRYRIAVHHPQRIAALDDVDARQRAPGAADRVKGAAAAGLELGDAGQIGPDDALGALERFMRRRPAAPGFRAAASRRCATRLPRTSISSSEPPPRSPTMPSGLWMPETTPSADNLRFARARQDFDRDAADALGLGDEVGAVGGVAAGGGGDRVDAADLHAPGTARESAAATSAPWRRHPAPAGRWSGPRGRGRTASSR